MKEGQKKRTTQLHLPKPANDSALGYQIITQSANPATNLNKFHQQPKLLLPERKNIIPRSVNFILTSALTPEESVHLCAS
jgi:hypothetical protein